MKLNHLPDELFHVLFGYFDVPTLLATCALVCKRWRELIHQMRFKELYFKYPSKRKDHNSMAASYTNFWDHLPVPLDPRHLIRSSGISFFDFSFIKMFEHLKRLKLACFLYSDFDFSKLNQFSALEELDVYLCFMTHTEKTLKLPRLRVLKLTFQDARQSKLTVDCPIKVLSIRYPTYSMNSNVSASLNLVYPDILEEIIVSGKTRLLNFSACKNVRVCRDYQYLYNDISLNEVFPADHLATFPNLQELHYQYHFSALRERFLGRLMNTVWGKISAVLQRKRQQDRSVKIFFQGIQLEGERFLESLELKTMNDLPALQAEHYDLLATNLNYYDKIDYSSLEKHFDDSLPGDLFSRFTGVNTVITTGGVKHLNQFTAFLRQSKYLSELKVELDSLDQAFCDQLHVNCFFLKKLVLTDSKKEQNKADGVNPVNQGDDPVDPVDPVDRVDNVENQGGDLTNAAELAINDDRPFKKLNFDFLAKQINLQIFSVGEFDMETVLRCLQIFPSSLFGFTFEYQGGKFSILKSKRNNPYSLKATFCESHQDKTEFNTRSKHISFDDLAFDLECFMKKIDKLALKWAIEGSKRWRECCDDNENGWQMVTDNKWQ